jgi:uncharacterized protein
MYQSTSVADHKPLLPAPPILFSRSSPVECWIEELREARMARPKVDVPQKAISEFCRRRRIRRLSFFGSVLREDFRDDSDLDVLVEFEPDSIPGFLRLAEMEAELETLFGGRKVDLRTPQDLSKYFREDVVSNAAAVYE